MFHFKTKHKKSDLWRQLHCNPAQWDELLNGSNGKWVFNSSVAEQTNTWIVGYHSMLCEIYRHNYEFFLDEMITLRNASVIVKLGAKNHRTMLKNSIEL